MNIDCHYCEYALTESEHDTVDCYADDYTYFDHHVTDSEEAKNCIFFKYYDVFPKL